MLLFASPNVSTGPEWLSNIGTFVISFESFHRNHLSVEVSTFSIFSVSGALMPVSTERDRVNKSLFNDCRKTFLMFRSELHPEPNWSRSCDDDDNNNCLFAADSAWMGAFSAFNSWLAISFKQQSRSWFVGGTSPLFFRSVNRPHNDMNQISVMKRNIVRP
jgi:hypothetical protein